MAERLLVFDHLHQAEGWHSPGCLVVDADGLVTAAGAWTPQLAGGRTVERVAGFAVPGMPNLHSHAFQRAMTGFAESVDPAGHADSFWTWRARMYELAARMTPEDLEAVAAQAFVEMLAAGYTSVAEFHYLHHDRDGARFADPAEMSQRVLAAAQAAGIGLTLLPVLYLHGGVGQPLRPEQRRFGHRDVAEFLQLVDRLRARGAHLGIAPHSLRAVAKEELHEAVAGVRSRLPEAPIHMHVAEQEGEVAECLERLGARPVQWLLDHAPVDRSWCLVHATQVTAGERRALAARTTVGLCPTTEANLGDGIFPLPEFLADGGSFGIGSDSQIRLSVTEELRLLETTHRLLRRRRNVLAAAGDAQTRHVGRRLFDAALRGGAAALARPVGALRAGGRADVVVLDAEDPQLSGHGPDTVLDAWLLGGAERAVRHVLVGGRWVLRDRMPAGGDAIRRRFAAAMGRLVGGA